jgi:hypothetical protein
MQLSIVHLSNVVCAATSLSKEDVVTSFEETADKIPGEVKNREALQLVLRQVASGIRNSGAGEEWEKLLSRLLH